MTQAILAIHLTKMVGIKAKCIKFRKAFLDDPELPYALIIFLLNEIMDGMLEAFRFGKLAQNNSLARCEEALKFTLKKTQTDEIYGALLNNNPAYSRALQNILSNNEDDS